MNCSLHTAEFREIFAQDKSFCKIVHTGFSIEMLVIFKELAEIYGNFSVKVHSPLLEHWLNLVDVNA